MDWEALEHFARGAERVVTCRSPPSAAAPAIRRTAVTSHIDRDGEADATDKQGPASAVVLKVAPNGGGKKGGQHIPAEKQPSGRNQGASSGSEGMEQGYEAASVLLSTEEVCTLAAELDPLRQVDRAFTVLEAEFGADASDDLRRRHHRSPLRSYAAFRRCRSWHEALAATGSNLLTTRLKLGRRGLDLLLVGNDAATAPSSVAYPRLAVTAATEVIAEATALASTAARSQLTHTTDSRGGGDHPRGAVLTARALFHSPLPEFSTGGIQGFDGWGYYGRPPAPQRMGRTAGAISSGMDDTKEAGEPVAVLEISSDRARKTVNADGKTFGEHMTLVAALLSAPSLRTHPNLIKFHPGARVVLDARGSATSGGGGDCAAGGAPMHIICERLQGWRPLCDVILEHGPLASPIGIAGSEESGGMRVLRLWGKQIASVLELLGSRSLVLRDLHSSTVFVSPDGSTLKVVGFSSLTTLASDGIIAGESHVLDHTIHGPTKALTPPEAITTKISDLPHGVAGPAAVHTTRDFKDAEPLALVDTEHPGVFPASAMWDVWTFGVLLFELAFGHPPPAYGSSLGRAVASSIETAVAQGTSPPEIADVARAIQYDCLSTVHGLAGGSRGTPTTPDSGFSATKTHTVVSSPLLAEALGRMSLGAFMGVRGEFHVSPIVRSPGAGSGCDPEGGASRDDCRAAVARFQQAWVRRQLEMEERGESGLTMPWQMFQRKLKIHLDLSTSIAAPARAVPFSQAVVGPEEAASLGGDEGGGGRRTIPLVEHGYGGEAATTPLKRHTTAEVAGVDRTMSRLREADSSGTGWLPFHVMLGLLQEELQLPFSNGEAEMIAACLRDGAPSRNRGSPGDGNNTRRPHSSSQEDEVFYQPLVHVLRASLTHTPPDTPSHPSHVWGASPRPNPVAFAELLCLCMEPDPARRPCPTDMLRLPFFSGGGGDFAAESPRKEEEQQDGLDLAAAAAYLSGAGNDCSPTMTLRNRVERPVHALETAFQESHKKTTNVDARYSRDSGTTPKMFVTGFDATAGLGAGTLAEALKELERLVHRSPVHQLVEDPQKMRMVARGYANVVDEIFESELLVRVSVLALRFLDQEEVRFVRNLSTERRAVSLGGGRTVSNVKGAKMSQQFSN